MFAKWKIYFKSKMKDEEWGLTNILLWTSVLNEFAITEKELIEGTTKACFARELNGWPPTTATDFINVIRGELINNYPDMRQAYLDAANSNYSAHAVIYETARRVGFWDLKSKSESVTYKSWQQHYPKVCSEHASGAQFALPKERQLSYSHTPVQPNSPFNAKIDAFFEQFGSKGKAAVQ